MNFNEIGVLRQNAFLKENYCVPVLLADVAIVLLAQVPLLSMILLEIPNCFVFIIFEALVKNKLRVVHNPTNDKLIYFVVVESSMASSHLTVVNGFEILYNFLLFTQQDMIFVLFTLLVQRFCPIVLFFYRSWKVARKITSHDTLVVNEWRWYVSNW